MLGSEYLYGHPKEFFAAKLWRLDIFVAIPIYECKYWNFVIVKSINVSF
jgi:hypothetical protein